MKILIDKYFDKGIIKNKKIILNSSRAEQGENFINEGLLDGSMKYNFIFTQSEMGEISHVIEIEMDNSVSEDNFATRAKAADQISFDFNNTVFIKPVNHYDVTPLELVGKTPTFRVESFINYYDVKIDDAMRNIGSLPNIYNESLERQKVSKEVIKRRLRVGGSIGNSQSKVIFDSQFNRARANSNKSSYPCYCEIVVSKKDNNIFTKIMSRLDLFNFFMNDVVEKMFNNTEFDSGMKKSNLLNYMIANISSDNLNNNSVIGNRKNSSKAKINFLDKLEAMGELQKESIANSNFKSILEKKTVPNETIFYKIEKFNGAQTDNVLKTYLLPSDKDVTTFVDTAAVYNSTYSYRVTAYVIIYGASYKFHHLSSDYVSGKARYKVVSSPKPIIVEMELFTKQTTPSTSPPLSPSVNFVNETSSRSSIKMVFNLREGRELAHPIRVLSSDRRFVYKNHFRNNLVRFTYIKEPIKIEILRMETKPISIFDFDNAKTVDDLRDETVSQIEQAYSPLQNYAVGTAEHPIWGRKFKIRVKSTSSGKMVDFNVKFDLIKDEKNEDS
jgi:hypothetical protein